MITTLTVNVAIDKILMVDNFHKNGVFRVSYVDAQAGGKGLNVARVAQTLGEDVVATGLIGGHNGCYIEESLKAEGIRGDFVTIAGESRICLNIIDQSDKSQTELLEPGPEVTPDDIERLKDKIRTLASQSKVVTMSGSLARGLPDNFYAQLIDVARSEGARVILDTSGHLLQEGLKARPFMVKPNQKEGEALTGKILTNQNSQFDFLKSLLDEGIEVAVLSLGKSGAVIGSQEGYFRVIIPEVQAINTVGCGDAFVAGFAVGVAKGKDVSASAKLAAAAATASATCLGTGQCHRELIEELLTEIHVESAAH